MLANRGATERGDLHLVDDRRRAAADATAGRLAGVMGLVTRQNEERPVIALHAQG